jgi:acyl-CoA synthetase (AMP-forming)/AMP-acid ligase II
LGSSLQQKWNWQKGDLLTLVLPNSIDLPLIAWGTISIGGVVSPLNLATAGNGLAHYLKDSGSKAVITQRAQYQVVSKAAQEAGLGKSRVVALEDINQDMWLPDTSDARPQGSESPPIPDPAHETAFLVYSSGTSGLPKGVMLSHTNIVANMIQTLSVDSGALTSRDTTLAFLPMSHIMGKSSNLENIEGIS